MGGLAGISATALTEYYDPATDTWTGATSIGGLRAGHVAVLLANGKVLAVGGVLGGGGVLSSAELFDPGLGVTGARRPIIVTATNPVSLGATLVLSGTGFRGDSEASNGAYNSSPANIPVVQLLRIDNQQLAWIDQSGTSMFSNSAWSSAIVNGLQPGPHLLTMFVNGIPSASRLIGVVPSGSPPVLQGAVSRRAHGSVGTFDLPLSLVATNPTTEPRQGPTQTVVLTFNKPIAGATSAIAEGAATAGAPTYAGNDVVVS